MKVGVAVTDLFTGMYATVGILAALQARGQSGRGQALDIALFDVQVAMLANQGMNYLISGETACRFGNEHPSVVPSGTFATADGYLAVTIGNDEQFRRLCDALGAKELGANALYMTNSDRCKNRTELVRLLSRLLKQRRNEEWLALLENSKVSAAPVNSIAGAFSDPQSIARGLHVELHTSYGDVPTIASPLRLSQDPVEYRHAPPTLGAHTNEVLSTILGFSPEEIETLQSRGVIRSG